jgi:hypothetical protein
MMRTVRFRADLTLFFMSAFADVLPAAGGPWSGRAPP